MYQPPAATGPRHGRPGVLLVNVGTPDAPTRAALRRYLREFLSDRRVVEMPRALWWPILHGIILNTRPRRSARRYAAIWTPQGSPLLVHTRSLAHKLAAELELPVEAAMRYGRPRIDAGLDALQAAGCREVLVVPLHPQYASATVGSVHDAVFDALRGRRELPGLTVLRGFPTHPAYIAALKARVEAHWATHGEPEVLLLSFHGLPVRCIQRGDPYERECRDTAQALVAALGLQPDRARVAFQSRFGRGEWLQPFTDRTLHELGRARTRRVDVLCPGFLADGLETLEEIAREAKQAFLNAGGGEFHYLPALNDGPGAVALLAALVRSRLAGGAADA